MFDKIPISKIWCLVLHVFPAGIEKIVKFMQQFDYYLLKAWFSFSLSIILYIKKSNIGLDQKKNIGDIGVMSLA
jgi:hypothetical protein